MKRLREIREELRRLEQLQRERDILVVIACRRHSQQEVAQAAGISRARVQRLCSRRTPDLNRFR